jgi:hypothetical protein
LRPADALQAANNVLKAIPSSSSSAEHAQSGVSIGVVAIDAHQRLRR